MSRPFITLDNITLRLGAQLLKWAATEAIVSDSVGDLSGMLLASMARYWPKPACANALLRAAVDEVLLLPGAYDDVKRACLSFVK